MKTTSSLCLAFVFFSLPSLAGCTGGADPITPGNGSGESGAGTGTGTPRDEPVDEDPAEALPPSLAECNDVAQRGASVEVEVLEGVVPAPRGGALTNGTYVLTAVRFHTASAEVAGEIAPRGASTITISGSTMQYVRTDEGNKTERKTMTVERDGAELLVVEKCVYDSDRGRGNPVASVPLDYTATATSFLMHQPTEEGTYVYEYTKR